MKESLRRSLVAAGGAAIDVNAPMSEHRGDAVGAFVARAGSTMLDLGCGSGWLACRVAARHPNVRVAAVDLDGDAIRRARSRARALDVAERTHFEVADASSVVTAVDTAVCVGASHAFGDAEAMLRALRGVATVAAVVGDGVWMAEPSTQHVEMFGELPRSVEELAAVASDCGWTVVETSLSTLAEWDRFESSWGRGVRDVGTPAAAAFADARWAEYQSYRGVLGFGWLHLATGPPTTAHEAAADSRGQ